MSRKKTRALGNPKKLLVDRNRRKIPTCNPVTLEAHMRGPPPQPAHLKLLRGNPGQRPVKREPEPASLQELPEPPEFLDHDAQGEWHRIIGELVHLRLVTALDIACFGAYCQSFAYWKQAVEALNRAAIADPETGGLVIQDKDGPRPNPLLRVVRSAGDTMLQLAREFGLSPIARARLASAGFEPPPRDGKFDGLIA
jgi:P27 family predicted phage terminase small subunit